MSSFQQRITVEKSYLSQRLCKNCQFIKPTSIQVCFFQNKYVNKCSARAPCMPQKKAKMLFLLCLAKVFFHRPWPSNHHIFLFYNVISAVWNSIPNKWTGVGLQTPEDSPLIRVKTKASKKAELAEGSSSHQSLIFHGTYNNHIIPALSELVFLMGNGIN